MKLDDFDLNNPIFVAYLDVSNMQRNRAEEKIRQFNDYIPSNINMLVIASDKSDRIECIFDGHLKTPKSDYINRFIDLLNDEMFTEETLGDFKTRLREFLLNELLNGKI